MREAARIVFWIGRDDALAVTALLPTLTVDPNTRICRLEFQLEKGSDRCPLVDRLYEALYGREQIRAKISKHDLQGETWGVSVGIPAPTLPPFWSVSVAIRLQQTPDPSISNAAQPAAVSLPASQAQAEK